LQPRTPRTNSDDQAVIFMCCLLRWN
jgi:hypothetical protein